MFQLRNHQNTVIDILSKNRKGQIIVPTGGGKTMCMIEDAKKVSGTIVVVAPRILLAEQLSSEFLEILDNVSVMHVHSGETTHFSSTKASGLTRDERRKIKRAGQRLVKDMQKGRERPRSAYEPGMSIAMRK